MHDKTIIKPFETTSLSSHNNFSLWGPFIVLLFINYEHFSVFELVTMEKLTSILFKNKVKNELKEKIVDPYQ